MDSGDDGSDADDDDDDDDDDVHVDEPVINNDSTKPTNTVV